MIKAKLTVSYEFGNMLYHSVLFLQVFKRDLNNMVNALFFEGIK